MNQSLTPRLPQETHYFPDSIDTNGSRHAERSDKARSVDLEVDSLRGFRPKHHPTRAKQPAAMGRDRDLRHRGRGWRLLRLGLYPVG